MTTLSYNCTSLAFFFFFKSFRSINFQAYCRGRLGLYFLLRQVHSLGYWQAPMRKARSNMVPTTSHLESVVEISRNLHALLCLAKHLEGFPEFGKYFLAVSQLCRAVPIPDWDHGFRIVVTFSQIGHILSLNPSSFFFAAFKHTASFPKNLD